MNEAENLPAALGSIPKSSNLEVIVVDGGSQDSTAQIASDWGAKVLSVARSRACQMNAGAKVATGDILLFLHADTLLPTGFDTMVINALCKRKHVSLSIPLPTYLSTAATHLFRAKTTYLPIIPKCLSYQHKLPIAGAFRLRINSPLWSLRLIERGVNWRSRTLQMPYGDQAIFLKAELFHQLGGFPELPFMEDFEFMLRLRRLGRIAIIPEPVLTSGRRWLYNGVIKTTLMNQVAIVAYLLKVSPKQIVRWYRGF